MLILFLELLKLTTLYLTKHNVTRTFNTATFFLTNYRPNHWGGNLMYTIDTFTLTNRHPSHRNLNL